MWVDTPGLTLDTSYRWQQSSTTLDGQGESQSCIGPIWLSSGPGTSKTISAAGGGKIVWTTESQVTWATTGSTLRIGLQNVSGSTYVEDGAWDDVYTDLVQGSAALALNTVYSTVMQSGSMTLAHGDMVACVAELTVRNGSDSVRVAVASDQGWPYGSMDTGTLTRLTSALRCVLIFDDGTVGYFAPGLVFPSAAEATAFNSSSAYDEYGLVFTPSMTMRVNGVRLGIGEVDTGETGDMGIYAHATSASPVPLMTMPVSSVYYGSTGGQLGLWTQTITPLEFRRGVTYAIAYKATSTGSRQAYDYPVPEVGMFGLIPLGSTCRHGYRADATGAFTLATDKVSVAGISVSAINIPTPTARTRTLRTT